MFRRNALGAAVSYLIFMVMGGIAGCKHHDGGSAELQAIYGQDERQEYYQLTAKPLLDAADATALVVDKSLVAVAAGSPMVRLTSTPLGQLKNFCSSEPYLAEPSVGHCSAFLASEDTVVTASHCIEPHKSCADLAFVFDYAYLQQGSDPTYVPQESIYTCHDIVAQQVDTLAPGVDYLVVRLDRKVLGHHPLVLNTTYVPAVGDTLVMLGHPLGLPLKIAMGGKVRTVDDPGFFKTTLDSFFGNSGSPVILPADGSVVGIIVRGEADFYPRHDGCLATVHCAEESCYGEDVVRSATFADAIHGQRGQAGAAAPTNDATGCWHTAGVWGWNGQSSCQNFPRHCNGAPSWCTIP